MTDLQQLQANLDAIELGDNWPLANGEQIEEAPNQTYLGEAMEAIGLVAGVITPDNIDALADEDANRLLLAMQHVRQRAGEIINLLESGYYG